ncbi:hypothetical protein F2Q68_00022666 [Brassica cretica]|uniref:Uncharacterized protein n=1 Tax=Brassica cretica TaxID=69181 RepID=A0A8S9FQV4_BRACR|nr:hypothetical protein F2Q68_00022666 [Brassica cretica]
MRNEEQQCNVKRVVPERVLVVEFLPCEGVKLVAVGDKNGNVGFWNLGCQNEEEDGGVSLFKPHTYSVTSLVFQQNSFSKSGDPGKRKSYLPLEKQFLITRNGESGFVFWESGDPGKRKSYLPLEKQFLITRNVPCLRRAASVAEEYEAARGEVLIKATKMRTCRPWCLGYKREKRYTIKIPTYFGAEEEDDDIPDMEKFDEADNVVENDTVTLQSTYHVAHEPNDNILRTCTNDINQTHNTSLHLAKS